MNKQKENLDNEEYIKTLEKHNAYLESELDRACLALTELIERFEKKEDEMSA
jgi:hypothetical protein